MAKSLKVVIVDKDTRINFGLPIGIVARLVRFAGDIANVFSSDKLQQHFKIAIQDYKVLADFIDALKEYPAFTLVDIKDGDSIVLIRTED